MLVHAASLATLLAAAAAVPQIGTSKQQPLAGFILGLLGSLGILTLCSQRFDEFMKQAAEG